VLTLKVTVISKSAVALHRHIAKGAVVALW
jgi:hypothetical protein